MRPNIASASFIISLMLALTLSVVPARQLRGSQQTLDHVKVEGEWSPKQLLEDITTDWPKVVTNLGLDEDKRTLGPATAVMQAGMGIGFYGCRAKDYPASDYDLWMHDVGSRDKTLRAIASKQKGCAGKDSEDDADCNNNAKNEVHLRCHTIIWTPPPRPITQM